MPLLFIIYSILFGLSIVMTARSIWKRSDPAPSFVLALFLLLTLFYQLGSSEISILRGGGTR